MKNFNEMMKQAQAMQNKMAGLQNDLENIEVTGESGGGMVKVLINGKNDVKSLKIDKTLINPDEIEILEDLIVAAFRDGKLKVENYLNEKMEKVTGNLGLPKGFKLPF